MKYIKKSNHYIYQHQDWETELGDSKQTNFYPQVKIKRWNNEVNLSYRLLDDDPTPAKVFYKDNKVSWVKSHIEVHQYRTVTNHFEEIKALDHGMFTPEQVENLSLEYEPHAVLKMNGSYWGSDSPREREIREKAAREAYGDVLVVGLGIGVINEPLFDNPKVKSVTIIEFSQEVVDIVEQHFPERLKNVNIVIADYFDWVKKTHEKFDYIYGDIFSQAGIQYFNKWERFVDTAKTILKTNGSIDGRAKPVYDAVNPEDSNIESHELEIVLNKKPKSNVLIFSLQSKNVEYFYQPFLTDDERRLQRDVRSKSIEGSYAIYHADPPANIEGGPDYGVGKIGHIYRPKIIDATGKSVWGKLHIDAKKGLMTVEIPQDFLDSATYPVRHAAGSTFGYTTAGASTTSVGGVIAGSEFAGVSGTVSSISVYVGSTNDGSTKKSSIYSAGGTSQVSGSDTGDYTNNSGNTWMTTNTSGAPVLSSATTYVIVGWSGNYKGGFAMQYDVGSANQGYNLTQTYGAWPSSIASATKSTNKYSIYATYTGGAPLLDQFSTNNVGFADDNTTALGDDRLLLESAVTFFGTNSGAGLTTGGLDQIIGIKYTLSAAGTVSKISVWNPAGVSGTMVGGIYTDVSGVPGTLIVGNNTPQTATAGQFNDIPLASTHLNAGDYWLVAICSASNMRAYKAGPGGNKVAYNLSTTYGSTGHTMPSSFPTPTYSTEDYPVYATIKPDANYLLLEDNASKIGIAYSYPSGDYITYTPPASTLSFGTTYYWRVRLTPIGSSTPGPWSEIRSFTLSSPVSTYTATHTTDANKKVSGTTKIHTTDSLKRKQSTVSHTTDSNKKRTGLTVTHTTDANKKKSGLLVTHTSDANKKKSGLTKFHTTDANRKKSFTVTHTTDSLKRQQFTKTHTTDSLKRKQFTISHTTDANKKRTSTVTHTTDANKKRAGLTVSHTTDSLKRKTNTLTHTTDALKRKQLTLTHTTDSNKKKSGLTKFHTTDSNKKKSGLSVSHTTDALKRKQFTVSHTTNALKRKAVTVVHTTDSWLHYVGKPVWVSPTNHATGSLSNDPLVFIIPSAKSNMHFHLETDTVNTFNSGDFVEYKSWISQTNWQYYNGSSWVSIPSGGVDPSYAGNQARYTPTLATNTYYRRIRGRIVA